MADLKALAEELVNLSVKDVKELADILKEEYGIEPAAAAVAVAAAPAGEAAAAKKPAAAKKTTATKAATTAAKTTAAKKAPAKKATATRTKKEVKHASFLEFGGNQYDVAEIQNRAEAAFKDANKRKRYDEFRIYIKPEENKAFYVVKSGDKESTGSIDL